MVATSGKVTKSAPPPKTTEPARSPSTFEEIERLFDSMWPRGWVQPWHWDRSLLSDLARMNLQAPKIDIVDRDSEVLVKAEVPGVAKADLQVSVSDNTVTIKGETRQEEKEEKGDYFRREMRRGSFSRTVTLPCTVDGTKAKAQFKEGILELTLPKVEASKRVAVKIA